VDRPVPAGQFRAQPVRGPASQVAVKDDDIDRLSSGKRVAARPELESPHDPDVFLAVQSGRQRFGECALPVSDEDLDLHDIGTFLRTWVRG
jgi:hypothetical protein